MSDLSNFKHKPHWLKVPLPKGEKYIQLKSLVHKNNLATICESGNCPNMGECWNAGTATFMILGINCTRNCLFCDVNPGKPLPPNPEEPLKIAESIRLMKLNHCVITSVTRDDLVDYGASHWANTINKIKELNPNITMEVLIPDMHSNISHLKTIADAKPEIISHNIETIERLYPQVRPQSNYVRSLNQISDTKKLGVITKSGFMVGMGETTEEIFTLLKDLKNHQVEIVTIGQYLAPSPKHFQLVEYITPQKFEEYKNFGHSIGIPKVISAPLVRSSYHSESQLND